MTENIEKEDWEDQRDSYKTTADAAFRLGNFVEAIDSYSNAIALDPTNHVLLSNRSAAHLKQGNKSKALQDAKACIEAEPSFSKGYSRLAAAQQSLGRWADAKESYEKVLNIDPGNSVAKQGIENCQSKLKEIEENKNEEEKDNQEANEASGKSEEDDLLDDFFSQVENEGAKSKEATIEDEGPKVISNQKKDLGTAAEQIDRLLKPNYPWRNLNPFLVLDLDHTATEDDIGRRYKALSLLLHPDKCRQDRAKEAYDEVQRAKKMLSDEDKARHVRGLIEQGNKRGKQVWQEQRRKDKSGNLSSLQEIQAKEVQRLFAEIEYQRREVEERERKQEQREREQEEAAEEKERRERRFDKHWREEGRVEKRIGNWRDFAKPKKSKS